MKKTVAIMLLSALLFTACAEVNTSLQQTSQTTTGDKECDDISVFTEYFSKIVDEWHIQEFGELIVPKHMQYFGESNGWRIYRVVYAGQIYDAAYAEMDLGGYKFKCNGIFSPSAPAIYAIKRKEVLTLKEAYEKGEIDIKEVYDFTPEEYKAN